MGARYWREEASKHWRPQDFIVGHMDFVSECQELILHRKMLGKELITLKHFYKCHRQTLIFTGGYSFSDVYAFIPKLHGPWYVTTF